MEKLVDSVMLLNDCKASEVVVCGAECHLVEVSVKVPVITVTKGIVGIDI